MAREMLLLKSVWDGFRGLWLWSWLLHWGLYLYVAATVFVLAGAVLPRRYEIARSIVGVGYASACVLGLLGSVGLLVMRAWHPRLRGFSGRTSIFNLLLLGSIFVTGALSLTARASGLEGAIGSLPHFPVSLSPALYAHVTLVGFFLVYFPFTHMTHAYMKFFTWHQVRWDDTPAIHDPGIARALAVNLQRNVTWAAQHIAGGKTATWSEVVADPGGRGSAKRA